MFLIHKEFGQKEEIETIYKDYIHDGRQPESKGYNQCDLHSPPINLQQYWTSRMVCQSISWSITDLLLVDYMLHAN